MQISLSTIEQENLRKQYTHFRTRLTLRLLGSFEIISNHIADYLHRNMIFCIIYVVYDKIWNKELQLYAFPQAIIMV